MGLEGVKDSGSSKAAAEEAARRAREEAARRAAEEAARRAAEARERAAAEALKKAVTDVNGAAAGSVGLKKAATGSLPELPWDGAQQAAPTTKQEVTDGLSAQSDQKNKDFMQFVAPGNLTPEGQEAAKQLIAGGKFDAIDREWGSLRDGANSFLSQGGDKNVASALLKQIADPDQNVWQARETTCVAATAQKAMIEKNPGEYFRVASDIIRHGEATLANGDKVTLSGANRTWIDNQNFTPEQKMDAMVQAALMDYGNGDGSDYNMAADLSQNNENFSMRGLNGWMSQRLTGAVLGCESIDPNDLGHEIDARAKAYGMNETDAIADYVHGTLQDAKAKGQPGVFVSLQTDADGVEGPLSATRHMVIVKGMDHDGNVTVADGNGPDRTMSKAEFAQAVARSATEYDNNGNNTSTATTSSGGGRRR
jgi:hypothetical protein